MAVMELVAHQFACLPFFKFTYFMCMGGVCLHVRLYTMCLRRPERRLCLLELEWLTCSELLRGFRNQTWVLWKKHSAHTHCALSSALELFIFIFRFSLIVNRVATQWLFVCRACDRWPCYTLPFTLDSVCVDPLGFSAYKIMFSTDGQFDFFILYLNCLLFCFLSC